MTTPATAGQQLAPIVPTICILRSPAIGTYVRANGEAFFAQRFPHCAIWELDPDAAEETDHILVEVDGFLWVASRIQTRLDGQTTDWMRIIPSP